MFDRIGILKILILGAYFLSPSVSGAERGFVKSGEYIISYNDKVINSAENLPGRFKKIYLGPISKRDKRYYRRHNLCSEIIKQDKNITSCIPNFVVKVTTQDPYVFECSESRLCLWSLDNINDTDIDMVRAWEITEGSDDIVVAVLDTGLDITHPDIVDNLWTNPDEIPDNQIDDDGNGYIDDIHGINALNDSGMLIDDNGHGTHVAGIIAATRGNRTGISGAAPKIKILPIKILDSDGSGDIANVIKGIEYLLNLKNSKGVPILVGNNSWGGIIPTSQVAPLEDLFKLVLDADILMTAAAGNGGTDSVGDNIDHIPFYPARFALPNIISVAATNFTGRLTRFSNYGPSSVHIAAPGDQIRSLLSAGTQFGQLPENGTCLASGTSMATPYVSAVLSLIKAKYPELSSLSVKSHLFNRSYQLPLDDSPKIVTGARINAYYALTELDIPTPTPLPSNTPKSLPTNTPTVIPDVQPSQEVTPIITPETETSPITEIKGDLSVKLIQVAPIKYFPKMSKVGNNYISAKFKNLIYIETTGSLSSTNLRLNISSANCLILSRSITNQRTYLSFNLNRRHRNTRRVMIDVIDVDGIVMYSISTKVRGLTLRGKSRFKDEKSKKC